METESMKQRRYDLSMSKRTRKPKIATVVSQVNKVEERELVFTPIISQENGEEVLNCTPEEAAVSETVFAPATPRPSLKELIQVTNMEEERDAREDTEQDLVKEKEEKVFEREKEESLLPPGLERQRQIVMGVKAPGVVRRCAKALNQIMKVRYGSKKKNGVTPLVAM